MAGPADYVAQLLAEEEQRKTPGAQFREGIEEELTMNYGGQDEPENLPGWSQASRIGGQLVGGLPVGLGITAATGGFGGGAAGAGLASRIARTAGEAGLYGLLRNDDGQGRLRQAAEFGAGGALLHGAIEGGIGAGKAAYQKLRPSQFVDELLQSPDLDIPQQGNRSYAELYGDLVSEPSAQKPQPKPQGPAGPVVDTKRGYSDVESPAGITAAQSVDQVLAEEAPASVPLLLEDLRAKYPTPNVLPRGDVPINLPSGVIEPPDLSLNVLGDEVGDQLDLFGAGFPSLSPTEQLDLSAPPTLGSLRIKKLQEELVGPTERVNVEAQVKGEDVVDSVTKELRGELEDSNAVVLASKHLDKADAEDLSN